MPTLQKLLLSKTPTYVTRFHTFLHKKKLPCKHLKFSRTSANFGVLFGSFCWHLVPPQNQRYCNWIKTRFKMDRIVPNRARERGVKMVCGAFYIPKGKKENPQGDDAHFICAEKQTIGVADGVGGWSRSGVDAGQYARELMANCVKAIENAEMGEVDPRWVLDAAYSHTNVEGSSTACILTIKNNHAIVANVGDSGFLVIREGKEVFKSTIQQRRFNCPYQLGNETSSDRPNVAELYKIPVKPGDVIVVGTDGLLDNMFSESICCVAKMMTESNSEPQQAAWAIAEHAYYNSVDGLAATPFTQSALMAGKDHIGGKADDITVIVAYIVSK